MENNHPNASRPRKGMKRMAFVVGIAFGVMAATMLMNAMVRSTNPVYVEAPSDVNMASIPE